MAAPETVHFPSGARGERCEAWLYRPGAGAGAGGRGPLVVMGHGLGAVRGMRLDAFAERFAEAGYACLVFDYRGFGGSEGEPRQVLSVRRQLEDWEAAIAHGRGLEGVDPDRVVAFGTSFGGGHALRTAARDRRLAAAIAQCPFTDGVASALAVPPLTSAKVTVAALRDLAAAVRGRPPVYLPAAGKPGATAFMTSDDALPGVEAIAAGLDQYDDRIAARGALDLLRYSPGRTAKEIACPVFVALCEKDTVAPAKTARRQCSRAPRAEIRGYPIGHFEIYLGAGFERAVADYLAFLAAHVPAGGGRAAAIG